MQISLGSHNFTFHYHLKIRFNLRPSEALGGALGY